jgi:membrane associated rhomboid family serine protease
MLPIKSTAPVRYPPVATWSLIAINCVVFLFETSLSDAQLEEFLSQFALVPSHFADPAGVADYLPFVSNMFLHGGWLHLILNMWTLWLFGPTIEDRFGHGRYLAFYLACGVLASITHAVFNPTSTLPALGASGAIAGVLGCYLRLFPLARVIVLVPILFLPLFFEIYAFVFIGIWIAIQVFQGVLNLVMPATGGGVAWWAHIGGFAGGLAFATLMAARRADYRRYYGDEGILGFTPTGVR